MALRDAREALETRVRRRIFLPVLELGCHRPRRTAKPEMRRVFEKVIEISIRAATVERRETVPTTARRCCRGAWLARIHRRTQARPRGLPATNTRLRHLSFPAPWVTRPNGIMRMRRQAAGCWSRCGGAPRSSAWWTTSMVRSRLAGLTLIESMPSAVRNSAMSG